MRARRRDANHRAAWSGLQQRLCKQCGKSFYLIGHTTGIYCSRECSGRAVGGNGNTRDRGAKRKYACGWCRKDFESYYKNRRYCSAACSQAGNTGAGNAWRGGKKDANHDFIVAVFEREGCAVIDTHLIGGGFPDLLVSFGELFLRPVEIKNRLGNYGKAGLNQKQKAWALAWKGGLDIVFTEQDAVRVAKELRQWHGAISLATEAATGGVPVRLTS